MLLINWLHNKNTIDASIESMFAIKNENTCFFKVELLKLSTAFLEDNEMRTTAKVASTTVKSSSTFT